MASIKDLKKRIGSVKNTQQTTRAMKMVSAAKLRRAQEAILNQRPYAKRIAGLIQRLSSLVDYSDEAFGEKYPLLYKKTVPTFSESDENPSFRILIVLVTSDRGLCGAFNSNVIKTAQRWAQERQKDSETKVVIEWAFVGRKGYEFFKNRKISIHTYFNEAGGKVTFLKAKTLSDTLVSRFLKGEFDEIKFVYNEFKNAISQKVILEDFLPFLPSDSASSSQDKGKASSDKKEATPAEASPPRDTIIKPSFHEALRLLLEKNFALQAFRILLESQAGEHGSRMSSMENATKNAGEMIRKLTLQYNKQRQAGITKELLEIISGSESQKASS